MIIIPTIPHCGTRFLTEYLLPKAGYSEDDIWFRHVYPANIAEICDMAKKHKTIMPLRSPENCALSWKKRGLPASEMYSLYLAGLMLLHRFPQILVLPIDSDVRDAYLGVAMLRLGVEIETDWPIVKPHCNQVAELDADDMKYVEALNEFVGRWY